MATILGFTVSSTLALCQDNNRSTKAVQTVARTKVARRTLLQSLITLAIAPPVHAVCGESDPNFVFYLPWSEDLATLPDGRSLHVRTVGKPGKRPPLLVLLDAGVPLPAGEPLELFARARRVVQADLLGVGESSTLSLPASSFDAAVTAAATEALTAAESAGVQGRMHVFAAGFGIAVAQRLAEQGHVAGAAIEAWRPIPGDATLKALLGSRVCAVEAARDGNITLTRLTGSKGFEANAVGLAATIPTLALRGVDETALPQVDGLTQVTIPSSGRLPHLTATEPTLEEMNRFFSDVDEQLGIKA